MSTLAPERDAHRASPSQDEFVIAWTTTPATRAVAGGLGGSPRNPAPADTKSAGAVVHHRWRQDLQA